MAFEIPVLRWTRNAGEALPLSYICLKLDTTVDGNAFIQATAGGAIVGVGQMNVLINQEIVLESKGLTKVVLGATVTPGILLEVDGSGRAIPKTTGATIGYAVVGGAVNEIGTMLLV